MFKTFHWKKNNVDVQNKPELYDDCITTPTIQQYLFDVTLSDGQTIFNPPPQPN